MLISIRNYHTTTIWKVNHIFLPYLSTIQSIVRQRFWQVFMLQINKQIAYIKSIIEMRSKTLSKVKVDLIFFNDLHQRLFCTCSCLWIYAFSVFLPQTRRHSLVACIVKRFYFSVCLPFIGDKNIFLSRVESEMGSQRQTSITCRDKLVFCKKHENLIHAQIS